MDTNDNVQGEYRQDLSFFGYDYERQVWVDTSPLALRDAEYRPGSASNPLESL